MKVTNVQPIVLSAPLDEPWRIATAVFTSMQATLVGVDTDSSSSTCIPRTRCRTFAAQAPARGCHRQVPRYSANSVKSRTTRSGRKGVSSKGSE